MKAMNKTLLATAIALASSQSIAAGFLLNEHSASGLGRAFAGEGATNDNASVLARNPAAMALFDTTSVSVVGTYIDPGVDMRGVDQVLNPDNPASAIPGSALDINGAAPEAFVPAAYAIIPLNEKVAIGFASFTNFGLGTDFGDDYAAGAIGGKTDLLTANFNASVSYRLNDQWSLGAGFNAVYGDAELKRHLGAGADLLNNKLGAPLTSPESRLADMSGDGWGFGYNVGVLYELNEKHRFALTYRSKVKVELEGEYTNDVPAGLRLDPHTVGMGGQKIDGSLDLNLPDIAEFSGYSQVSDQLTLHYGVMWTGWSEFQELSAIADEGFSSGNPIFDGTINPGDVVLVKEENFEDAWRYSLGATYQLNDTWALRAGVAYDETPIQEEYRSISIPDSDRIWYTAGATYTLSDRASLDFGLAYIDGEEVDINEEGFQLTSEGDAKLVSAQFNYAF